MMSVDNKESKILIIDNNTEEFVRIRKVLEKESYDIYDANNANLALEIIDNVDIDLVLLNAIKSLKDSFEICKLIKEKKNKENLPIVFFIDKKDIETLADIYESGATDYIAWPFIPLELTAKVKIYIEPRIIKKQLRSKSKELEEIKEKLRELSITDPLTKLVNRKEIQTRISNEISRATRNGSTFAILIGDIDNLKNINSDYGTDHGDQIINEIAHLINYNIRKQDIASRWDGAEFLLLLPDTNLAGGLVLAKKLRKLVEKKIFNNDKNLKVTMTFGVCSYSKDISASELLNLADKALQKGKEKGRNQVNSATALYDLWLGTL